VLVQVNNCSCLRLLYLGRKVKSLGVATPRGFLELMLQSRVRPTWLVFSPTPILHTSPQFAPTSISCCRITAGHEIVQPETVGMCISGKTGQDGSWHSSRGSDKLRPSSVEAAATHAPGPLQGSEGSRGRHMSDPSLRGSLAYAGTCEIKGHNLNTKDGLYDKVRMDRGIRREVSGVR
jgi:hypothetical protein